LAAATASGGQMIYVWLQDGVGNQYYYNYAGVMLHYDNTAPSNPNSVTESGGMVSNTWQSTIGDPSFSWSGADDTGGSGLKGYSVYWGPDAGGEPGTVYEQASHIYDPAAFTGTYALRVRTFDNAGNMSSPITLVTAKHDATAPTNPGTATEAGGMVSGASALNMPVCTGLPERAAMVRGLMNLQADSVITTVTWQPSRRRARTQSATL